MESVNQFSEKVSRAVRINISVSVKVNGLIRTAVIPPISTQPKEASQVTLWQGGKPVKVRMTQMIQSFMRMYKMPTCDIWSNSNSDSDVLCVLGQLSGKC